MGGDAEGVGEGVDGVEGDVALAPLDRTDVGAVEAGEVGEALLGEPARAAQLPQALPEGAAPREGLC